MKKLLFLFLTSGILSYAQYVPAASGSSDLNTALDGKLNYQVAPDPTTLLSLNGIAGKDVAYVTSNGKFYVCTVTASPCGSNWLPLAAESLVASSILASIAYVPVTFSATPTFTVPANVNNVTFTIAALTANVTSSTFVSAVYPVIVTIRVCQDATGSRTMTFPTNFVNFGSVSNVASKCSSQTGTYDGTYVTSIGPMLADTTAGGITGNARTATALAANGTNCTVGNYPLGVDAGGNAENCTAVSVGTGIVSLTTGVAAGIPASCTAPSAGTLQEYFATDTHDIYFCRATDTWQLILSVDPAAPFVMSGAEQAVSGITTAAGEGRCVFDTTEHNFTCKVNGSSTVYRLTSLPTAVLAYLANITSDVQTQLNAKAASTAATTVNGQTCTLGSTCTIPLSAVSAKTATYQVLAADFSNYKTITVASGTFTITLVASGSQPADGQYLHVINYGSGVVTIARSGQNINGGTSSLTLAAGSATAPTSATITSNGTNYFARVANAGGGGSASIASTTNAIVGDGAGNGVAATGTGTNCLLVNGSSSACAAGTILQPAPGCTFDGGGSTVPLNSICYQRVRYSCTLSTSYQIMAQGSSPTATFDIFKVATGSALPTSSIISSGNPALATGNAVVGTTAWTSAAVTADDILAFKVTAVANATWLDISTKCN